VCIAGHPRCQLVRVDVTWHDTKETFVNKKFLQLKSTIELLAENGWQGCTLDDQTAYVVENRRSDLETEASDSTTVEHSAEDS
jgi:hypothetical protein